MTRLRRHFITTALVCLAPAATMHGQAQAQQPSKSDQTTTLVGCLVQGPSQSTEEYFLRTPAIAVPAGSRITVGGAGSPTSGRATTSAGMPDATTAYRITGLTTAELKPHVGHRIELQGRLSESVPPATSATTTQDPKTGRATTAVKEDWTIAGVLNATAMKMVAASCQ